MNLFKYALQFVLLMMATTGLVQAHPLDEAVAVFEAFSASAGVVPEFSTVEDSPFINVELENHGYSLGQAFAVPTPTTVGGIVISGAYLVQAVTDADNFTIIEQRGDVNHPLDCLRGKVVAWA